MNTDATTIRIALADDQSLVREGLAMLLGAMEGIEVALVAASGAELLERLRHVQVDVAIVDIRMPGIGGFEVLRALREDDAAPPVILLTTFNEPDHFTRAVRLGAKGLLLKGVSPPLLREAIVAVRMGGRAFPVREGARDAPPAPPLSLTHRERELLQLAADGMSNKEIARELRLTEGTVKNYMSELFLKLGVKDRTHAVMLALSSDLL